MDCVSCVLRLKAMYELIFAVVLIIINQLTLLIYIMVTSVTAPGNGNENDLL